MEKNVQLDAIRPNKALCKLKGRTGLCFCPPLNEKSTAAGLAAQKLGLLPAECDGLIRIHCRSRYNAHLLEQAIEAVGLQQLTGKLGIDELGIK